MVATPYQSIDVRILLWILISYNLTYVRACVRTYIHAGMFIHTCIRACSYMHIHTCMFICSYMHTYICRYRHTCTHQYTCTCIHTHTHMHTYPYTHTHIRSCAHTHMHIHPHTHAHVCTHTFTYTSDMCNCLLINRTNATQTSVACAA